MSILTEDIYNEMAARNLTVSMRQWSEEWLGRSHNFASINRAQPLPAGCMVQLRKRLIDEGHHDLAAKVLLALLGELPASKRSSGRRAR